MPFSNKDWDKIPGGGAMTDTNNLGFIKILDDFYEYLFGILKVYEDLLPVIKEELNVIGPDDISSLDENLKAQQALLYRIKNFDRDVAGYASKLNIKADTLSSMILKMPEEHQLRFYELLGNFAATIQEVSFYKDKCQEVLQTKLYGIDKALTRLKGVTENKTYERDASEVKNTIPNSFETTI